MIDPTSNNRKPLNYLTTLTTEPNVYSLEIDVVAVQSLKTLNLLGGLKKLKIIRSNEAGYVNNINFLRVPASVEECELTGVGFDEIIFEHGGDNTLKLLMDGCSIDQ